VKLAELAPGDRVWYTARPGGREFGIVNWIGEAYAHVGFGWGVAATRAEDLVPATDAEQGYTPGTRAVR
jgi:hypothetical protein